MESLDMILFGDNDFQSLFLEQCRGIKEEDVDLTRVKLDKLNIKTVDIYYEPFTSA